MDPQDGARMVWDGDRCDIHRLSELMLTRQTRLYKIAYFEAQGPADDDPVGYLADSQSGQKRASDYFLQDFLCCKYPESPQEATATAYSATMAFLNESEPNPERRAQYTIALVSELASADRHFVPQSFAHRHMDGNDRPDYENFLLEREGIAADAAIRKDVTLIKNRLKVTTLGFEGGINVIGSSEAFSDFVETDTLEYGQMRLTVVDRLKTVKT